ncbi:cyanophycinase [Nocardioides sp.]|uniref:cyanophycinase n=1 Tax=Nocardioides sp. TaxID=35761 RepID=UPI002ED65255
MRLRLGTVRLIIAAGTTAALALTGVAGAAEDDRVMTPIGGGYETPTLEAFAIAAADGASGPTVDLVVVPAAYGDAPADRAENLELAQERTDQVEAACDAVVAAPLTGCTATLAVLLNRADALDPANSTALADPGTDGIFVLGGDQGLAMSILADSPAEAAMHAASDRGAVVGGTSAGAAVESLSMINGYVGDLGPEDGLRQGSTLMWWGDDGDAERGLAFGSTATIYDQHFYQRGRFGRTISTIATADERAATSPVGVGIDYGTGVRSTGDHTLSDVFGQGSVALVDLETLGATHEWVGDPAVLSARGILTHLLTTGSSYDLVSRTYSRGGTLLPNPTVSPWTTPADDNPGTLVLGGGDVPVAGVGDVVAAASQGGVAKKDRIVVVVVGAKKAASAYVKAVKAAGWTGSVATAAYGTKVPDLTGARGVLVVAPDPVVVGSRLSEPAFRSWLTEVVTGHPAVLTDGAVTAALGEWYSPKRRSTSSGDREDLGIASFQAGDAAFQPGLGLVDATLVPWLNTEFGWGRLYAGVSATPETLAVGVNAGSSVTLAETGAATGGSVVVADGRAGTYWTAENGAIGASGVVLDVFGPGEQLTP